MATITEDYVSFETAKLLREKGFNAEIDTYYSPEGEFDIWCPNERKSYLTNDGNETWWWKCIAPSQSMAMKWLREVHDCSIEITSNGYLMDNNATWECDIKFRHRLYFRHIQCEKTYEDCAEAVEADRNNRRANTEVMADIMKVQAEGEHGLTPHWYSTWYMDYYRENVKGSIEEEFADIVIRLLDMAYEIHGDRMEWRGYYPWGDVYHEDKTFIEQAWHYVKEVLNWGTMNISDSVSYIFDWADHLDIDLKQHIEWKMKYNEYRPYKHGGKKY